QGWAVVENQTDEDWNGVRMALISGRPISFQMNLYDALFIKRPVVEPELFASLRPVAYSGGFNGEVDRLKSERARVSDALRNQDAAVKMLVEARSAQQNVSGRGGIPLGEEAFKEERDFDLSRGVSSAASASKLGDYFQYSIDHAVNLPRQKSALL